MAKIKRVRTPEEKRNLENQILKIGLMLMGVAIISLIVILLVTTLINKEEETIDLDPFKDSDFYKLSVEEFEEIFSGNDDLDIKDDHLRDVLEREEFLFYIFYNSQYEELNEKVIEAINNFYDHDLILLIDMDSEGFKNNEELNVVFDSETSYYGNIVSNVNFGTIFYFMKYSNINNEVEIFSSNGDQISNLLK